MLKATMRLVILHESEYKRLLQENNNKTDLNKERQPLGSRVEEEGEIKESSTLPVQEDEKINLEVSSLEDKLSKTDKEEEEALEDIASTGNLGEDREKDAEKVVDKAQILVGDGRGSTSLEATLRKLAPPARPAALKLLSQLSQHADFSLNPITSEIIIQGQVLTNYTVGQLLKSTCQSRSKQLIPGQLLDYFRARGIKSFRNKAIRLPRAKWTRQNDSQAYTTIRPVSAASEESKRFMRRHKPKDITT